MSRRPPFSDLSACLPTTATTAILFGLLASLSGCAGEAGTSIPSSAAAPNASSAEPAQPQGEQTQSDASSTGDSTSNQDDSNETIVPTAPVEPGNVTSNFSAPENSGFQRDLSGGATESGYETISLNADGAEYNVQTNPWGGAEQTITAGGTAMFRIDSITHPTGGNAWDVATFPSVYKGTANGGYPTANSGLPLAVSEIDTIYTGLKHNAVPTTYQGNATYDVYFTERENYTGGGPDVYVMVWFDAKGLNPINGDNEMWNCDSDAPLYIGACSAAGSLTVHGKKFYRFIGPNGDSEVISYVPETVMGEWEFDLNAFIHDATEQGLITADMYLQSVQGGFEVADAGAGLALEDFYVDVVAKN